MSRLEKWATGVIDDREESYWAGVENGWFTHSDEMDFDYKCAEYPFYWEMCTMFRETGKKYLETDWNEVRAVLVGLLGTSFYSKERRRDLGRFLVFELRHRNKAVLWLKRSLRKAGLLSRYAK